MQSTVYWTLRKAHGLAILTVLVWLPVLAFVGIRRVIRRGGGAGT